MGKSKKTKNVVNQDQKVCSETKDCRIENSSDFLTSDDFCIVQKKKNCRKLTDDKNTFVKLKSSTNVNSEDDHLSAEKELLDYNAETESIHASLETPRPGNGVKHCGDDSDNHESSKISTSFNVSLENINESYFSREEGIRPKTNCLKAVHGDNLSSIENDIFTETDNVFPKQYCDMNSGKIPVGFVAAKNGFDLLSDNDCSNEDISDEVPDEEKVGNNFYKTEGSILAFESHDQDVKIVKKKKKKELRKKQVDKELEQIIEQLNSCKAENFKDVNLESNLQNNMKMDFVANAGFLKCDVNVNNCEVSKVTNKIDIDSSSVLEFSQEAKCVSDLNCVKVKNISGALHNEGNEQTENADVVQNKNLHSEQHTLKTAAQKKKEKKAREKLKRLERYVAESSRKPSDPAIKHPVESETNEISDDVHISEEKEENIRCTKIQEQEKKDRKKPGKKQLALIQEALKKAKEEEERLRKEEEARQKAAEEAEKLRQEKLRQEQERKDKKKLKEKQRRERMKAEGRLLSKSQKQSRARMEATLAALREQGVDVPQIGEKKPHGPRLGNYRASNRKRLDSNQSTQSSDGQVSVSERHKSESLSSQESSGKESVIDFPSSFDSKDSWDVSSIEALTPESETGHLSCSEESDILDENSSSNLSPAKEALNSKLKLSLEKSNLKKVIYPLPADAKPLPIENKKDDVKLRSPVVCVLGHVDTGKTKILDYIRKTHVQDAEAGGITQQIGATMIPRDALTEKCKMVKDFLSFEMKVPGLLVIDTPGHESFSNLRSRGSSVCDIGVLVVDIMHGLQPQTIESINLLRKRKIPFIVALNKIDRIYGWKSAKDEDIENTINDQSQITLMEFKKKCQDIILQFAKECLNAALFYENSDPRTFVSMVPTSAITGDGMGNILSLITQLTQSLMHKKLIFSHELQATVLEVKAICGLGTTIDVILVNGCLHEGDTIVLAGHDGPVVTQIRSLLMPQPLKELRVKNPYIEYKKVDGAQGVKVTGKDLDRAIAGLPLLVAQSSSKVDHLKEEIMHLFRETMNSIKTSERGVYVQASTLGSLEALLEFLNTSGISYFGVKIGPVVKKDVMKASIMLEHDIQYSVILAFDVKVEKDAQELADILGVRIFHADIIYHLFDMYVKYREDLLLKRKEEIKRLAVFPCKLKILSEFIFSVRDPIILGVSVEAGVLRENTPLCIPSKDNLEIGTVTSIEVNHKSISSAKKGQEVCIKIEPKPGESPKMYGRHFEHDDLLVSRISRCSIDICKEHFRDDFQSSDWHLMVELKKLLHIV